MYDTDGKKFPLGYGALSHLHTRLLTYSLTIQVCMETKTFLGSHALLLALIQNSLTLTFLYLLTLLVAILVSQSVSKLVCLTLEIYTTFLTDPLPFLLRLGEVISFSRSTLFFSYFFLHDKMMHLLLHGFRGCFEHRTGDCRINLH